MPIRLKRYESGLLVIQSLNLSDDRVAQRIFNHVKKYGPLTAMKISELENLALPVAVEQLHVSVLVTCYNTIFSTIINSLLTLDDRGQRLSVPRR